MSFFECCHRCSPPKRYPGCHSVCPEYIERKKLWDEIKEAKQQALRADFTMTYAQKRAYRISQKYK